MNGKRGKDIKIALTAKINENGKTNFNGIFLFSKRFKPINPLRRISGKIPSTYLPIGLPKRDGISDSYFILELIALLVANKIIKIKEKIPINLKYKKFSSLLFLKPNVARIKNNTPIPRVKNPR